jgi:hypothetical protein
MATYIVKTTDGGEFNGYYNKVSVIDTRYETNEAGETIEVLEVEVEDWYASAYERSLDAEPIVISYRQI